MRELAARPRAGVQRSRRRTRRLPEPAEPAQPGALAAMLLPGFLERYGDRIEPEHAEVCETLRRRRSTPGPATAGRRWGWSTATTASTTCCSPPTAARSSTGRRSPGARSMLDGAYFIGGGAVGRGAAGPRARHSSAPTTTSSSRRASKNFDWRACWDEYRRQTFHGLLMAIVAVDGRRADRPRRRDVHDVARAQRAADPRPRRARAAARSRSAQAGRRCGPDAARRGAAHRRAPSRCGTRAGTSTRSATTARSASTCASGDCPNQGDCALHRADLRTRPPDDHARRLRGAAADVDDDSQRDRDRRRCTRRSTARSRCERFRVALEGTGAGASTSPARCCATRPATPIEIALDLRWMTDGEPYAWRQSTRYEIPCRVDRDGRIGDETIEPQRRRASATTHGGRATGGPTTGCGARSTSTTAPARHAVGVPQIPGYGVGYVQRDGEVDRDRGAHRDRGGRRRTVSSTPPRWRSGAVNWSCSVEPLAFGPLLPRGAGRPRHPLPPRDGRVTRRRRALRERLDRVESRPAAVELELRPRHHLPLPARSSVGERSLHTPEVGGSKPPVTVEEGVGTRRRSGRHARLAAVRAERAVLSGGCFGVVGEAECAALGDVELEADVHALAGLESAGWERHCPARANATGPCHAG